MQAVTGIAHRRNPDARDGGAAGMTASVIQKGWPVLPRRQFVRVALIAGAVALELLSTEVAAVTPRAEPQFPVNPLSLSMERLHVCSTSSEQIDSSRATNGTHSSICPRAATSSRFEAAIPAMVEKADSVPRNK